MLRLPTAVGQQAPTVSGATRPRGHLFQAWTLRDKSEETLSPFIALADFERRGSKRAEEEVRMYVYIYIYIYMW